MRPLAAGPHALCPLAGLPDGQARGFILPLAGDAPQPGFPYPEQRILVVRQGDTVRGYGNICPLDWTPDQFMSLDGRHLQCATHGALFRVSDGHCVAGPCRGKALPPIRVTVTAGMVTAL